MWTRRMKLNAVFMVTLMIAAIGAQDGDDIENMMKQLRLELNQLPQLLRHVSRTDPAFENAAEILKFLREYFVNAAPQLECSPGVVEKVEKCEEGIEKIEAGVTKKECTFRQEDFNCIYLGMVTCKQIKPALGNVTQFLQEYLTQEKCPPLQIPDSTNEKSKIAKNTDEPEAGRTNIPRGAGEICFPSQNLISLYLFLIICWNAQQYLSYYL